MRPSCLVPAPRGQLEMFNVTLLPRTLSTELQVSTLEIEAIAMRHSRDASIHGKLPDSEDTATVHSLGLQTAIEVRCVCVTT